MFWLFEAAEAHSHGHSHGGDELYLFKQQLSDRTAEIQKLYQWISSKLKTLPDPFPLSYLPDNAHLLFADLAVDQLHEQSQRFAFLEPFFVLSPFGNAIFAALNVTFLTHFLLRYSPELQGWLLNLLVSIAEGCILGNVFFHLVPESYETAIGGWGIVGGFVCFCVLDKALKLVSKSVGHVQTHSHSHGPSLDTHDASATTSGTEEKKSSLKSKKSEKQKDPLTHSHTHSGETLAAPAPALSGPSNGTRNIYAVLNVAADFAHNITDGVALTAAFYRSTSIGVGAFIVMILHEVPHQFGDFALLVQGGASKAAGLQAQLVASSGTLLGCILFKLISNEDNLEYLLSIITPFTAGVFLYIGTVGVLPELLEVSDSGSIYSQTQQGLIQILGVFLGLFLMSAM